jgi:C-terminal processing protease CtpA/Prc
MKITNKSISIATVLLMGFLVTGPISAADQATGQAPYRHGDQTKLPRGVIGVSLQVGAERIGDPAVLYIGMVHPEGPAQKAGVRHGDEVVTVDGNAITGKSYQQVVKMIRGEAGTAVKLGVKNEAGTREVSITRVASDQLRKGPADPHRDEQP